jgi:orotate phosphoribosyltransferase
MVNNESLQALIREIAAASTIHGEFKLRSGDMTTSYFDKYLFEGQPKILGRLGALMASLLPADTELLAGLELGGIPLATAISLHSGIPTVFVRKQTKAYGTAKAVEGPSIRGRHTTIIEDVVTTGGAIIDGASKLRGGGAHVKTAVCAIWRGTDLTQLRNTGLELRWAVSKAELENAT